MIAPRKFIYQIGFIVLFFLSFLSTIFWWHSPGEAATIPNSSQFINLVAIANNLSWEAIAFSASFIIIFILYFSWRWWCLWLLAKAEKELSFAESHPIDCTEPPYNLSPSAMYYLDTHTLQVPHLIVPLWNLTVQGFIQIQHQIDRKRQFFFDKYIDKYYINRTGKQLKTYQLPVEEENILNFLEKVIGEQRIEIGDRIFCNRSILLRIKENYYEKSFSRYKFKSKYFPYIKISAITDVFGVFLCIGHTAVLTIVIVGLLLEMDSFLVTLIQFLSIPIFIIVLIIVSRFYIPISRRLIEHSRKPNPEGREVLNQIAGFKEYLKNQFLNASFGFPRPPWKNSDVPESLHFITTDQKIVSISTQDFIKNLPYILTFYSPKRTLNRFAQVIKAHHPEGDAYIPYLSIQSLDRKVSVSKLRKFFNRLFARLKEVLSRES